MAKGIVYYDEKEAKEYAKGMQAMGWGTLVEYDRVNKWYIVYVTQTEATKGKKAPTTLREAMLEEEYSPRKIAREDMRKLKTGVKESYVRIPRGAGKEVWEKGGRILSGKDMEEPLKRSSRRVDVMKGMKRAIPTVGGARHGYLARIGEMEPVEIAEMGAARIADTGTTPIAGTGRASISGIPNPPISEVGSPAISGIGTPRIAREGSPRIASEGSPRIASTRDRLNRISNMPNVSPEAGVGGVSKEVRFRTASKEMRFQEPYARRSKRKEKDEESSSD